jgi:hypothetical protein
VELTPLPGDWPRQWRNPSEDRYKRLLGITRAACLVGKVGARSVPGKDWHKPWDYVTVHNYAVGVGWLGIGKLFSERYSGDPAPS